MAPDLRRAPHLRRVFDTLIAGTGAAGWRHSLLIAAALLYPIGLMLLVILIRSVGERWWVTCLCLYLPRIVFGLPLPFLVFVLWRHRLRRLLSTQVVALAVLIFPMMGFVFPWPSRAQPGEPVVRVLSYNVDHAYAGPERIVAEIDRYRPDVVIVMKLNVNARVLTVLVSSRYAAVDTVHGFLVASRFPIVSRWGSDQAPPAAPVAANAPGAEPPPPPFVRWTIATPLGPVAFFDVHPLSARDGLNALARSVRVGARLLEEQGARRVRQIQELAAVAARETVPVVIAGDTNLPDLSPLYRRELGRYRDAFRAAGWGFGYTFPSSSLPWMRLDRILTSPELRAVRFQTGRSRASDHLCVVADLQRVPR